MRYKAYLLRLSETQEGTFYWDAAWSKGPNKCKMEGSRRSFAELSEFDLWALLLSFLAKDFVPTCGSCKNYLKPYAGDEQCPVCKGQKGPGKCFQFDCCPSALGFGCGELPSPTRPTYCGSHPFFGGYRLTDQVIGDPGPALWEEEIDVCEKFTISATSFRRQVFLYPGDRESQDRGGV